MRAVARPPEQDTYNIYLRLIRGNLSEPVTVTVDECDPPPPDSINSSSIDIEMMDQHLDVDTNGDIVVVVGVNISWDKPEITFGNLTRYQLWIGLQHLSEDDPNPEGIANVTVEVNKNAYTVVPLYVSVTCTYSH